MKIAMLGHKRIPSREGGVEIVVAELSTRLVQLGHRVTCYNRCGHHVSGAEFDEGAKNVYQGVRLKTVPTLDKKGLAAVTSSFFASLCAAFSNADVVHIHAEGPAFMCWLPKLMGTVWIGSGKNGRAASVPGISTPVRRWRSGLRTESLS